MVLDGADAMDRDESWHMISVSQFAAGSRRALEERTPGAFRIGLPLMCVEQGKKC